MAADIDEPSIAPARWSRWLPFLVLFGALVAAPFAGSTRSVDASPDDDVLRAGAEVFSSVCASCHQAGGVGLEGKYPPLVGNPHVDDAAYVEDVIRNGRTGEIIVNGVTYNGVMPAQATLSDADINAVIVYIQSGFAAPAVDLPAVDTGPVAGTELPALANYTYLVALLIALGLGAVVLGPRVIAANDRRETLWLDAWMKTAVIVVGVIVSVVYIPAKVLELETVQELPRAGQDLIAVSLWAGGLAVTLLALWYAHRERRI